MTSETNRAFPKNVHYCLSCCTKNRITRGQKSRAKCARCGKLLYPDLSRLNSYSPGFFMKSIFGVLLGSLSWFYSNFRLALVAGFVLWIVLSTFEERGAKTSRDESKSTLLPPPILILEGLQWNSTGRPQQAPFEINTRGNSNYLVKLVDFYQPSKEIAVYVRGNSNVTLDVPLGSYQLKHAVGKVWRGSSSLFGPGSHTSFHKSDDLFEFKTDGNSFVGYTVELFVQPGGNMRTDPIPRSSF